MSERRSLDVWVSIMGTKRAETGCHRKPQKTYVETDFDLPEGATISIFKSKKYSYIDACMLRWVEGFHFTQTRAFMPATGREEDGQSKTCTIFFCWSHNSFWFGFLYLGKSFWFVTPIFNLLFFRRIYVVENLSTSCLCAVTRGTSMHKPS